MGHKILVAGNGFRILATLEKSGYRRATICISSQVGCAVNCQFCLTAKLGIKRNLTAGEIAGQVASVLARQGIKVGQDRINLVFMGMGEPFLNYDSFMDSVRLLSGAMGIPESRMTVSTSGIEPAIRRFAQEDVRPKLALSLNASNDSVRAEIMPITRKWNIAALLEAVDTIPLGKREYVTFEYVLLGGSERSSGACPRGSGAAGRDQGEGQSNRLESRPGDCVSSADAGRCGDLSEDADRWRPADLHSQAARPGYLRRLRAVEADCCEEAGLVEIAAAR